MCGSGDFSISLLLMVLGCRMILCWVCLILLRSLKLFVYLFVLFVNSSSSLLWVVCLMRFDSGIFNSDDVNLVMFLMVMIGFRFCFVFFMIVVIVVVLLMLFVVVVVYDMVWCVGDWVELRKSVGVLGWVWSICCVIVVSVLFLLLVGGFVIMKVLVGLILKGLRLVFDRLMMS